MFDHWVQKPRSLEHGYVLMANALLQLAGEVRKLRARDIHLEKYMRQSTTDLIASVTDLTATVSTVGTAIDALVAAQASNDDEAVEAQVAVLAGLKTSLLGHLPVIATTAAAVVAAPSDPAVPPADPAPAPTPAV